jgi:general secretion pathway protein D
MMRLLPKSTAFKAVLFFFVAHFAIVSSLAARDKIIGNLTQTEVELSAVVEAFSKRYGKVILPNDGVLAALRPRKATIVLPNNLRDFEQNAALWDQIYNSILSIYGYTLIKKGDLYRLVPVKDATKLPTPIRTDGDGHALNEKSERIITQVIQLKHVVSDIVRPLFRYVSEVSAPLALPDKKTLVITAAESDLNYFTKMLELFDKPTEAPYIKTYNLERAIASQVKNHIQNYFNVERARAKGAVNPSQQAFLLPDDSTNRLLVSAVEKDHKTVVDFLKFFDADVKETTTFRPITIYKLKNSDAEAVAKKLDQVIKAKKSKVPADKNKKEDIPTIVPFEELNALIISVEEEETFRYVQDVIDMLDVKRNQVYIASTIVEVNNSNSFDFGATFGGGSAPRSSKFGVVAGGSYGTVAGTAAGVPGFADGVNNVLPRGATVVPEVGGPLTLAFPYGGFDFIPLVLKAAESDTNINVLANPSIICDDNEHAVIEITEERSFNTTTTATTSVTSFGGFNEAGIVLDIKPTISSDNFLKLEITQNVDRFEDNIGDQQVRQKRKATSVVTIPNKTSVVVGGLTQVRNSKGMTGIPLLHKIPVIGHAFKSKSDSLSNDTLYFFITPEIITDFDELRDITDRLHDRMGDDSSEDTRENPIFKDIRNKERHPTKQASTLPLLKAVFTNRSLDKWVKPGQAMPLALEMIQNRATQPGLFPSYTRPFFDESKLDGTFRDTLMRCNAELDAMSAAQRSKELEAFNRHVVAELEKLDRLRADGRHLGRGKLFNKFSN